MDGTIGFTGAVEEESASAEGMVGGEASLLPSTPLSDPSLRGRLASPSPSASSSPTIAGSEGTEDGTFERFCEADRGSGGRSGSLEGSHFFRRGTRIPEGKNGPPTEAAGDVVEGQEEEEEGVGYDACRSKE